MLNFKVFTLQKFLKLKLTFNSDINSFSEFLHKFTFVDIFENSQAKIMLKLFEKVCIGIDSRNEFMINDNKAEP